ncbi:MAG: hypothetical protein O2829_11165 [Bacteroidetes bacterium]|nr:hypothetical protein [Bacteroidota bacterium]MDA1269623.1 hypothetical protein [Bacteroidota bacterium]
MPLLEFIAAIEKRLGKKAKMEFLPMQPRDVIETHADISEMFRDMGYEPRTSVAQGVTEFTKWNMNFYQS